MAYVETSEEQAGRLEQLVHDGVRKILFDEDSKIVTLTDGVEQISYSNNDVESANLSGKLYFDLGAKPKRPLPSTGQILSKKDLEALRAAGHQVIVMGEEPA